MALADIKVGLKLPFLEVSGTWKPDESQRKASWEMYVELVTRISVVELGPDEGLLREALTSLYSLFGTTRKILRDYGPTVAQPTPESGLSFGYIAIAVLNLALRPVLAKWHPLLLDHENNKPASISALAHEKAWDRAVELRDELTRVRRTLRDYADLLAEAAGVPSLVIDREGVNSTMGSLLKQ